MAPKRIGLFFVVAFALYAVFVIPWPGVMPAYRASFRAVGNMLFGQVGATGSVRFEVVSEDDHQADMRIVLRNSRVAGAVAPFQFKSVLIGYRPTVFFLALILATPIPWSRRWRSLIWGLVGVCFFIVLRMWLLLVNAFSNHNPLAVYSFGPFFKGLLEPTVKVLFFSPAIHYIVPALIWLLVTFRRGDLQNLFGSENSPVAADRPTS